ncbi:AcrR family transcriptional regulator [Pseudochelatococcus lubricantis]|uniref:AcrR family transcriptional regulator n=1 Tax=Pseudochelatococcus lubricantis TaxID=1538102 RepID=A0ABX0V146_9HYPH|nr:TetR/AcrR family transcriptional regulator [Pseudochelatococcus lubricantis]NIJ57550.1 AcrR family transcriptional regulator [Pseudochelatococcus lubricantis]
MRTSKRERILDAVFDIIQRDGVTAVTFDAVAAETRLTRGGLLYHFPSREELILATHKHLAERWEKEMANVAGKDAESATPDERLAAYVQTCAKAANRAELLLMLESAGEPGFGSIWQEVIDRWAPPVPEPDDAAALSRFIARIAADGLWIHEALSARPLPEKLKERICRRIVATTDHDHPSIEKDRPT